LEQIPLERLEHEITRLASHINAGMCRWLQLVAEFDRREGWSSWGCRSCAEWVAWRCALDPRTAREHVRVARRLAQLPGIREAFGRGELSFTKVRALTRVADADSEDELLDLAHFATAAQLERIVRAYRRVSTRDANEVHEDRSLSWFWEPHGSLSVHGRLSPEDGALFLRAVESARDELWREAQDDRGGPAEPQAAALGSADGSAEPRPEPQQTNADALVRVAEKSLSQDEGTRSAGDRTQVAALSRPLCVARSGPAIAPAASRAASTAGSPTPTTSATGRTAAPPSSTTCSYCAAIITASYTRAGSPSSAFRMDSSCSPDPTQGDLRPCPIHRGAIPPGCVVVHPLTPAR